jgi:hypothetical protein
MKIVIPKKDSLFRAIIKKGSGIVMTEGKFMAEIYYEGNLYGIENLKNYEEKIKCAAGRAHTGYPTVATSGVLKENLHNFIVVGLCDPDNNYRIDLSPAANELIKEWCE